MRAGVNVQGTNQRRLSETSLRASLTLSYLDLQCLAARLAMPPKLGGEVASALTTTRPESQNLS